MPVAVAVAAAAAAAARLGGLLLTPAGRHRDLRAIAVHHRVHRPGHTVLVGAADEATARAEERLRDTLRVLDQAGLDATGYITHPDPLTSIMNAVQHDPPNEIIISTLPGATSNWLRGDLIGRVRRATGLPVEHVIGDPQAAGAEPVAAGSAAGGTS